MAEGAPAIQQVTLRELTAHQKRELSAIVAAGVASTAFCLIPLVQIPEPEPLPSVPVAVQVAAVVESPRSVAVPPGRTIARSHRPLKALAGVISTRSVQPVMTLVSATSLVRAEPPQASAAAKTPGKITRLLFGSGRYRVQPFPMPGEQ